MKYIYIIYLLLTLSFNKVIGQHTSKISAEVEESFKQRIKILDEFIERFNYEKGPHRELPLDTIGNKHQELLLTLFDEVYAKNADDAIKSNIQAFITQICSLQKPIKLNYHDKNWYAKSQWKATLDDKPVKLSITLVTEREPNKDRWSISYVEAGFLDSIQIIKNSLSPVTNDLDFMEIKKVLKTGEGDLSNYAVESYTNNPITKFFSLIENGYLVLQQASRPTYIFTQVPGWIFTLDYFERTGDNTGWRISKLVKANINDKAEHNKYLGL